MTISYVGQGANAGTTVTIPAHQSGDLILLFAYRDGNQTAPTTPAAGGTVPTWTLIGSDGANQNSSNFRYAVATANTTTSGTWTNATEIICLVYRGTKLVGASAGGGAASTSIAYPALTLNRTDGSSWVVGVAGHRSATNVQVAPTGMTNRNSIGTEAAGHDTNGTVSSWSQQTVTVDANSGWRSWTVELRDATSTNIADRGQFTLTGRNAGLNRGYRMTADRGQFTLTGQAANLNSKRTADRGQFTLTGGVAGLNTKRTTDRGQFALTGGAANLNSKRTADRGQFTLTGEVAGLSSKRTADRGQFAVTGGAVTFRRSYTVQADRAQFTTTGASAGLLRAYRELATTGAFTLTGGTVAFKRAVVLPAGTASYALTGHNVDLHYLTGLDLNVDTGVFALTGGNVVITRTSANYTLAVNTGAFTLTGSNAGLTAQRKLLAGTGTLLLTGSAASVKRTLLLTAGRGQFNLSGGSVVLGRGYRFTVHPGSFTETGAVIGFALARRLYGQQAAFSVGSTPADFKRVIITRLDPLPFTLTGRAAELTANRRRKVIIFM